MSRTMASKWRALVGVVLVCSAFMATAAEPATTNAGAPAPRAAATTDAAPVPAAANSAATSARVRPPERPPTLAEVQPGLWVGGAVPVAQMPGWPASAPVEGKRLFAIIDLRPPGESPEVAAEREAAAAAGVGYVSIPVPRNGPPPASAVAQLANVLRNAEGAPVVLHCVSGNRAGDLYARYLIANGTDIDTALARARALGTTPSRVDAIRSGVLGHP